MSRRNLRFSTVRTEGGLLPQDLLSRIQAGDKDLPGLTPESYHLGPHERIGEAVNRAWSRLTGAWRAFQDALAREPDAAKATGLTRERWLLPLFQELGYGRLPRGSAIEADGKSYAVSHLSPWAPVHLLGAGVDLDRRQAGVSGAAKASPHGLVQEFLNRSEKYLWGFVSNGIQLRILRDHHSLTRQAYVEFDLQALMEGEQYSDFLLLWMICHQSRVEADKPTDCWLERWFTASRDEGIRALDKLRGGVEKAIESLGTGFLAHRANVSLHEALETGELDKQEYYRQVLRLVYRLIFLFVAEERDALLDPQANEPAKRRYLRFYATRRLRELSANRRGSPHGDLWQGLRLVMSKLDDGCPDLALPALGSQLWGPAACPRLMGAECSNEHLLDAIRHLSNVEEGRTRYPVNWRNVGADELGSIYEGLLELHPRINKEAATFVLETAAGHERKTTGSYYTPTELVDCLLDSALDPVLNKACKKGDREAAILGLKVCDPACGSGHFLVAAARRIAKRLAAVRAGEDEPSPREVQHALRDVVGRCIYGVDVNPMAVELCKVSLWMEAIEPGRPLSFLDSHIQCGNALLGATPALMARGIPDSAFKPIESDDRTVAKRLQRRNKDEREGQQTMFALFAEVRADDADSLVEAAAAIESEPDLDIKTIRRKEADWERFTRSPEYREAWFQADAYCAAFLWPKAPGDSEDAAITHEVWRRLQSDPSAASQTTRRTVRGLSKRHRFFHWHLAFPHTFQVPAGDTDVTPWTGWSGGFDTILGNPPWIRQEAFSHLKPLLATYGSYKSTADLSVFFLEVATCVTRLGGGIGILTPNKWLRADYGQPLRRLLRERVAVRLLVDFGHSKTLFPDADTFPAAVSLTIASAKVDDECEFQALEAPDAVREEKKLADLLREDVRRVPHAHLEKTIWRLQDRATVSLLNRIRNDSVPLRSVAGPPLFGLKTGLNAAYCFNDATRDSILGGDPATTELVKPFARGRDIGRWVCYPNTQWILVLPSSANRTWPWSSASTERAAEEIFARTFPTVHAYLKPLEKKLRARSDQGTYWWELRSCDYYDAFTRPKIVVGDMSWRSEFAFDDGDLHVGDTGYVIPTDDLYVLAILNSRLTWWFFYNTAQPAKDDARRFRGVLGDLPVPDSVDDRLKEQIRDHAGSLLALKRNHPEDIVGQLDLELGLDRLISEAFGLSPKELRIIVDRPPPRDPLCLLRAAISDLASETGQPSERSAVPLAAAASTPAEVIPFPSQSVQLPAWGPDVLAAVTVRYGASGGALGADLSGDDLLRYALAAVLRVLPEPWPVVDVQRAVIAVVWPNTLASLLDGDMEGEFRRLVGVADLSRPVEPIGDWHQQVRLAISHQLMRVENERWAAGPDVDDAADTALTVRAAITVAWMLSEHRDDAVFEPLEALLA